MISGTGRHRLAGIEGVRPQFRDPRMNSQGNYCYVFHYDKAAFAGMDLRLFEKALAAEGPQVPAL